MLEKATNEDIAKLRLVPGEEVVVLKVDTLAVGVIVRARTASGNDYLLEIVDPKKYRARVVRCDARGPDSAGYRGEKVISSLLRIGDKILFGGADGVSYTRVVANITILPKEVTS